MNERTAAAAGRGVAACLVLLWAASTQARALERPPACPVSEARESGVEVQAAEIGLAAIGGAYATDTGWPSPGEPRVGRLRFERGLLLRSDDPRFADFDDAPGAIHSGSSGCWFAWEDMGAADKPIARVRIVPDPRGLPALRLPCAAPVIAGYRLASADEAYSPHYDRIGLWIAEKAGSPSSLIVAFDGTEHTVLAALPFRLAALNTLPDVHGFWTRLTIVGEGRPREPVPYLVLGWASRHPD